MSDLATDEQPRQQFLDRAGLRGFPWKTAITLYTISYGWLYFVRDSFWVDDWDMKFRELSNFDYSDLGLAPWAQGTARLLDIFGAAFLRFLIFWCFFVASVFLFGLSKSLKFLTFDEKRILALLFLLLPFNTARVALMTFHYTTGYVMFFAAWYLLVNFKSSWVRAVSIMLFFLSFQMHSLLVFYLLPVMHVLYLGNFRSLKVFVIWIRKNLLFMTLPVIYWACRSIFWPESTNLKESYQSISIQSLTNVLPFALLMVGLILILSFWSFKAKNKFRRFLQVASVGTLAIFLGLLPYLIYSSNLKPNSKLFFEYFLTLFARSDWYNRHLMLQPLGLSLLVVAILSSLFFGSKKLSLVCLFSILMACVSFNVGFGFEYVVDYAKQKEVVSQLETAGKNEDVSSVEFLDQTQLLNARGRSYRTRDWAGLVGLAFGEETMTRTKIFANACSGKANSRLVLIEGPETHWQALKNWVSDGDMDFKVTIDDTPGACKPGVATTAGVSGAIPILFYFTGAKK